MKRLFSIGFAAGLAAYSAAADMPRLNVTLHAAGGDRHFQLEYARTPEDQEKGLMFRHTIAPGSGMLFSFDPPRAAYMWMKNTEIPLDMLFLDPAHQIVYLVRNAKPGDLTPLGTEAPTAAVLELPAGAIDAIGVKQGDKVDYELPR